MVRRRSSRRRGAWLGAGLGALALWGGYALIARTLDGAGREPGVAERTAGAGPVREADAPATAVAPAAAPVAVLDAGGGGATPGALLPVPAGLAAAPSATPGAAPGAPTGGGQARVGRRAPASPPAVAPRENLSADDRRALDALLERGPAGASRGR